MEKKYILTDNTKVVCGRILYQIKALKDFNDVKFGQLGGWIEKEFNLSHDGNAWVYDNAVVYGKARILDNACVFDNAMVFGRAFVLDNARVYGNVKIFKKVFVFGDVEVF